MPQQKKDHFQHSFLQLRPLFLIVILFMFMSIKTFGQIFIPLSQINSELPDGFEYSIKGIEAFDNRLIITTSEGLWITNNSGTKIIKTGSVNEGFFEGIVAVNDISFVSRKEQSFSGEDLFISRPEIWLLSKNQSAIKVDNVFGNVSDVKEIENQFFVKTDEGLWLINKDGKKSKKIEQIKEFIDEIEEFNNWLFVTTKSDLLKVSKDGDQIKRIEGIEGEINGIQKVDDSLFISTFTGLWSINGSSDEPKQIQLTESGVYDIRAVDSELFIGTNDGLLIFNKNGEQTKKINDIKGFISYIRAVGNQILVNGLNDSWIISKDGENIKKTKKIFGRFDNLVSIDKYSYVNVASREIAGKEVIQNIYRIDPNVKIKTQLNSSNPMATLVNYLLPSNWLPSEKVPIKATYSDETGKDPYESNFPREFKFAKADGDTIPSADKFSTAEQFGYEIKWGKNEAHYWVKDRWGNIFEQKDLYYGIPSQYFFVTLPFILSISFILVCFALAPKVDFCHSAIMNPWLRKYFSLGSFPLLVSIFPALRRYILRRYLKSISDAKEFSEWKTRFILHDKKFLPENFAIKLTEEKKLLLIGQSGIGKTSFFKYLMAWYVSANKPPLPAKVFPVYISLTTYGDYSLEDLIYNQLFAHGKITDKELQPIFLEKGGLLIFLDGINEIRNLKDREKLGEFIKKYGEDNYICLSSQLTHHEIGNISKIELKTFNAENVCEFIRNKVNDKEKAEKVIKTFTREDYHLYSIPRDLEFAVEIINSGKEFLPKSRTELYKTVFSSIFSKWKENGRIGAEYNLCDHSYKMIVESDPAFDKVDNPKFKEITTDLFEQKFLFRQEQNYYFLHDLMCSYLASNHFYARWQNLLENSQGKIIDSNWLEMLKFSCENIKDSKEIKSLVYEIMEKSIRKDLVKDLFEWLKMNYPSKCESWEEDFYTKYGKQDFM